MSQSAIQEISLSGLPKTQASTKDAMITAGEEAIKSLVVEGLWSWINNHQETPIKLSFWFVHKTFTIADLEPAFELLLGPNPAHIAPQSV